MKNSNVITGIICCSLVLGFFFYTLYWCTIREKLIESRIRKKIHEEILKGNKVAIILKNHKCFILIEDEDLILKALEGNEYAIQALNIEIWMKK